MRHSLSQPLVSGFRQLQLDARAGEGECEAAPQLMQQAPAWQFLTRWLEWLTPAEDTRALHPSRFPQAHIPQRRQAPHLLCQCRAKSLLSDNRPDPCLPIKCQHHKTDVIASLKIGVLHASAAAQLSHDLVFPCRYSKNECQLLSYKRPYATPTPRTINLSSS